MGTPADQGGVAVDDVRHDVRGDHVLGPVIVEEVKQTARLVEIRFFGGPDGQTQRHAAAEAVRDIDLRSDGREQRKRAVCGRRGSARE